MMSGMTQVKNERGLLDCKQSGCCKETRLLGVLDAWKKRLKSECMKKQRHAEGRMHEEAQMTCRRSGDIEEIERSSLHLPPAALKQTEREKGRCRKQGWQKGVRGMHAWGVHEWGLGRAWLR